MTVGMLLEKLKGYDKDCRVLIYDESLFDSENESYRVKDINNLKSNELLLIEEGYTSIKYVIPENIDKSKDKLCNIMKRYYEHPVFIVLKAKADCDIVDQIENSTIDMQSKLREFAKSLIDNGYTMEDLYNVMDEETYNIVKRFLPCI